MPNLFIDLDGTLIDSRARQYCLFTELAPQCRLSFEEYWTLKRTRLDQATMLRLHAGVTDQATISDFHAQWLEKIEAPVRLLEDSTLPGSGEFLAYATDHFTLYLLTARQHPERVEAQIGRFGWTKYFEALLVTGQRQSKASLICAILPGPGDLLIGDTGEDVQAARETGLRSIAVCTGILNAQVLAEYQPDLLVESLETLLHSPQGAMFLGKMHE